jgi:hypothetical protein
MSNGLTLAKQEFLTDKAKYFSDKKDVYLALKKLIFEDSSIPFSMIRVCGSAYWGRSFVTNSEFKPGESDLDVALIDPMLFVRSLSEVRLLTRNFTNLTHFTSAQPNTPSLFQEYAYKKGIIRLDIMPRTKTKLALDAISLRASRQFQDHFSRVTFAIYDNEDSFTVKQIKPAEKFKEEAK